MKQYTENQYDDDLTVGTDEYDDSYHTDVDDLFEFSTDEESPISRLKSLILSIDWEITDEVLMEFNDELLELRGIWDGEKINLVYVQALEKISKYIYQKKAASHPSAIKLLLTLYHNLEKIVSSVDLSDKEKKEILLKDVKRFENLKREIGKESQDVVEPEVVEETSSLPVEKDAVAKDELTALKALVLGIDWEITDKDLDGLRLEVNRLEEKFVNNKPRLILLQGIGTIGAYIKLKKSDSHPDAFKVLHLFYESLERITLTPVDREEEKAILLPAVEEFNSFKIQLGTTASADDISRNEEEAGADPGSDPTDDVTPAFADIPEEDVRGFQMDEEAQALGLNGSGAIGSEIEDFFTDEGVLTTGSSDQDSAENVETVAVEEMVGKAAADMFGEEGSLADVTIAKEVALQGVDVEEGDVEDTDEYLAGEEEGPAPALNFVGKEPEEPVAALLDDKVEQNNDLGSPAEENGDSARYTGPVDDDEPEELGRAFSKLDREVALQGVDVETEADEEDGEEALPMSGEEVAPALVENDEVSIYNVELLEQSIAKEKLSEEIVGNLNDFFDDKQETPAAEPPEEDEAAGDETTLLVESAKNDISVENVVDPQAPPGVSGKDSFEIEESPHPDEADVTPVGDDDTIVLEVEEQQDILVNEDTETALFEEISEEINLIAEPEEEAEDLQSILPVDGESELSKVESTEADALFVGTEPDVPEEVDGEDIVPAELDQQVDSFFDLGETVEPPEEENLFLVIPEEGEGEDVPGTEKEILPPADSDMTDEEEVIFELAEEDEPFSPAFSSVVESESLDELPGEAAANSRIDEDVDTLSGLRTYVESMGEEPDSTVVEGMNQEINALREILSEKPVEKTFLQLLSTVTQHIDQKRNGSSVKAYDLLQSVCNALGDLQDDNQQHNQELLLAEVSKVLEWQQGMLIRQSAK